MELFNSNSANRSQEQFDTLFKNEKVHIQKIISHGQASSNWYDQEQDEWVCVIEGAGTLAFEDGRTVRLEKGAFIYIPAHTKHQVIYTATPTIWLAVHF